MNLPGFYYFISGNSAPPNELWVQRQMSNQRLFFFMIAVLSNRNGYVNANADANAKFNWWNLTGDANCKTSGSLMEPGRSHTTRVYLGPARLYYNRPPPQPALSYLFKFVDCYRRWKIKPTETKTSQCKIWTLLRKLGARIFDTCLSHWDVYSTKFDQFIVEASI